MGHNSPRFSDHTIIAGYGLPGRALGEALTAHEMPFCIIELNPTTVERCEKRDLQIIAGDCRDPEVLQQAGIQRAEMIAILIPDERAAVEATRQARRLNPSIRIITRCHYTSTGIEARTAGADQVIVSEQVVAAEASRLLEAELEQRKSVPH